MKNDSSSSTTWRGRAFIAGVLLGGTLVTVAALSLGQGPGQAQQQHDPLAVAMQLCVDAHPAAGQYASGDSSSSRSGQVTQTAQESCDRWLAKVGTAAFTEQWTPEYAATYRAAFAGTETER